VETNNRTDALTVSCSVLGAARPRENPSDSPPLALNRLSYSHRRPTSFICFVGGQYRSFLLESLLEYVTGAVPALASRHARIARLHPAFARASSLAVPAVASRHTRIAPGFRQGIFPRQGCRPFARAAAFSPGLPPFRQGCRLFARAAALSPELPPFRQGCRPFAPRHLPSPCRLSPAGVHRHVRLPGAWPTCFRRIRRCMGLLRRGQRCVGRRRVGWPKQT